MHLLIVEDERALCDTVARSLRRSAYSVDCWKRSGTIWCCWI